MAEHEDQSKQDVVRSSGEMSEDEIDYNVMGTFPASDPPSWTLGIDHRHKSRGAGQKEKPSADAPSYQNESTPSA
jgi:hypothetical protein